MSLVENLKSGGARNWTKDLSICSRMLYHWATPPWKKIHVANSHFVIQQIGKKTELKNKEGPGGTQVWTGDLSICSRMLYHWAIPPTWKASRFVVGSSIFSQWGKYGAWRGQTGSTAGVVVSYKIPILVTRVRFPGSADILSSSNFEMDQNLIQNCSIKGAPRFELGTSRSAVECSTTELYPLLIWANKCSCHIQKLISSTKTIFG